MPFPIHRLRRLRATEELRALVNPEKDGYFSKSAFVEGAGASGSITDRPAG